MAKRENIVSNPPLMTPVVDSNNMPSKAWAVWFRDMFNRVSNKESNSIDDNLEDIDDAFDIIDGTLDTLEEVIVVVIDHEARIDQNETDIQTNKNGIATNKQNILDLEYRVFGSARPSSYDEAGNYAEGEYVVNPSGEPQSYYRALEIIPTPAGAFDSNKWRKVSLKDNLQYIEDTRAAVIANFVAVGYGGIGVDAVEAIGTIDSTFQTLEGFDIDLIATPFDVTYDKANHGLKLDREGIWEMTLKVAITFDEVNAGRQIQLRTYNATTATAGAVTFNYFVGRNQAGVNLPLTIAIDVPLANVGDLIQLQIGSASDTFTNSDNIGTIYQVKHISEFKGSL